MRAIAFPIINSQTPPRMRHWGPEKNLIHTHVWTDSLRSGGRSYNRGLPRVGTPTAAHHKIHPELITASADQGLNLSQPSADHNLN